MNEHDTKKNLLIFFLLIGTVAFAAGFSDTILNNYFKDAYDVTAAERSFIEFPRELPGLLLAAVIAALSVLGDIRSAMIAMICSFVGIAVLGAFEPHFIIMLVFLFTYSLGVHIFMPLQDSIGMALAEPDKVGTRMGEYASVRTIGSFLAGGITFIGFRLGWFSFETEIKLPFIIAAVCYIVAFVLAFYLLKHTGKSSPDTKRKKRTRLIFRKKFTYYYILAILHGVQKQIALVYGSWVIIDLLLKGADTMSILFIVSSFIGIFLMKRVGGWITKFGIRAMMFADAFSFVGVYTLYGIVVWIIVESGSDPNLWAVAVVYLLFVLDRLSMQLGMVKSVYVKSLSKDSDEVTAVLSTGISLDHIVSILAALLSGYVWMVAGPQWVFFIAAILSLGNVVVAYKVKINH